MSSPATKMQIGSGILFAIIIFLAPNAVFASTLLSDNFDSYTNGTAVSGQGGWTSSASVVVSNTVSVSTPNSAAVPNNLNGSGVYNTFTTQTSGVVSISLQERSDTGSVYGNSVWFVLSGTDKFGLYMFNNGHFELFDGSGFTDTGILWSANTWYSVLFEYDIDNARIRVTVNGGTPSSWVAVTATNVDGLSLRAPSTSGGNTYVDDIVVSNGTTPTPSGDGLYPSGAEVFGTSTSFTIVDNPTQDLFNGFILLLIGFFGMVWFFKKK